MSKNLMIKVLLVATFIFFGTYLMNSVNAISGNSDNAIWEARYQKNLNGDGWTGILEQKSPEKMVVKKILFLENESILMMKNQFQEERMEDGSVTMLFPFSTEFYLGEAPIKNDEYKLIIIYEEGGEKEEDVIYLE